MKKPVGINSYEKDKLVIGKPYWTFYTFESNKGTGFRYYVKVFETHITGETFYSKPNNLSFDFIRTEQPTLILFKISPPCIKNIIRIIFCQYI